MKKLSLILAAVLLLTSLPLGIFAEGASTATYTEAQLLANRQGYDIVTTDQTGAVNNLHTSKPNVLKVLEADGAIKLSFTLTDAAGAFAVQVRYGETGEPRGHFYLKFTKDGLFYQPRQYKNNMYTQYDQEKQLIDETDFHAVNTRYTYIVLHDKVYADADNRGNYKIYRKTDADTSYTFVGDAEEGQTNGAIARVINSSAGYTVHSIQTFKLIRTYNESEIWGNEVPAFGLDFTVNGSTTESLARAVAASNISADPSVMEYSAEADGFKATDKAQDNAYPTLNLGNAGFSPVFEGGGMKITFKVDSSAQLEFGFKSPMDKDGFNIAAKVGADRKMTYLTSSNKYDVSDDTALEADTFYTYIFKRNKTDGRITIYKKKASDTSYIEAASYAPLTVTDANAAGLFRILCRDTSAIGSFTLKEIVQYLDPAADKAVMTNLADIKTDGSKMIYENNFDDSANTTQFTTGRGEIKNGVLTSCYRYGFDASSVGIDGSEPFVVKFRNKLTKWFGDTDTERSLLNFGFNGYRFYYVINSTRSKACELTLPYFVGTSQKATYSTTAVYPQVNVWYEYMFSYDGNGKLDVYRRREGDKLWTVLHSSQTVANSNTNAQFYFGITDAEYDDLQIFKGAGVTLSTPVISGAYLNIDGSIAYGTPQSDNNRRATLLGVVYNKTYGYTESINVENVTAVAGETTDISKSFSLGAATDGNALAMVWDSLTTALPLTEAKGYDGLNVTTTASSDALSYEVCHNEVRLKGNIGAKNTLTALLLKGSVPWGALQIKAGNDGMINTVLGVNPETAESGSFTLRLVYGDTATDNTVKLACRDIGIGSIASVTDFTNYINEYATASAKASVADDEVASEAYDRFVELKGNSGFADFYAFRNAIEKAVSDVEDEREVVALVNTAAAAKKWATIEELLTVTYKDYLNTDLTLMTGINSKKDMWLRMTGDGVSYANTTEILEAYKNAAAAQRAVEVNSNNNNNNNNNNNSNSNSNKNNGSLGGATTSGSGSLTLGLSTSLPSGLVNNTIGQTELQKEFGDIKNVPWAVESINTLQRAWIISGDENGKFNPDKKITREEFLKLLLKSAGIETDSAEALPFGDTDKGEWYYEYVSAAYKNGIVNGVTDARFGIGESITRADMAVMIKRVLELKGKKVSAVKAAFIFDDFAAIPTYARDSISYLCEAELLNGTGENRFEPMANTTRAEAAVAICRIYELFK